MPVTVPAGAIPVTSKERPAGPSGVQWYISQASRFPLLTAAEELHLARQIQEGLALADIEKPTRKQKRTIRIGKSAERKMVNANLRLVISVAKRYTNRLKHLDLSDLIQEGCLGVIHAVQKFDPSRGYKFSTYAYWWIRQSVSRGINYYDRALRVPVSVIETYTKLSRLMPEFYSAHGRYPTSDEICARLGITQETLDRALFHRSGVGSLDAKAMSDSEHSLVSLISDPSEPAEQAWIDLQVDEMNDALEALPCQQQEVLLRCYGIDREGGETLQVIGKDMKISRERVRQIRDKATTRLRAVMSLPKVAA